MQATSPSKYLQQKPIEHSCFVIQIDRRRTTQLQMKPCLRVLGNIEKEVRHCFGARMTLETWWGQRILDWLVKYWLTARPKAMQACSQGGW